MVNLISQKMGIHEWSYDNAIANDLRYKVPTTENAIALKSLRTEVELGFDLEARLRRGAALPQLRRRDRVQRPDLHRMRRLRRHLSDRLHFLRPRRRRRTMLRASLNAPRLHRDQAIYVAGPLKTGRIMVKDEDLCLHCGLCAERCPTGAWDMQKFTINIAQAEHACRSRP